MKEETMSLSYEVTLTDSGRWLHAPGSDFVFAYVDNSWSQAVKYAVAEAFETALGMSSTIKQAVKTTSGQDVVKGLYLLDQTAMTAAMNSIDGMGETSVDQQSKSGRGTAVSINKEFFTAVLAGLNGDVDPLMSYLTEKMHDLQAQVQKSTVTENFGTVFGLISVMPELGVVVTSFQYVFSSAETSDWFVKVVSGSVENYSYDYSYTVVNYNYVQSLRKSSGTYVVTLTDSGQWLHAPGSDFVFAYVDNSWSQAMKDAVGEAFHTALGMSSQIKQAVKTTSGQDVVKGLYLLDQTAMTAAMNSIQGMGQTSVDQESKSGQGTALDINKEFFTAILAGLSGDVDPLMSYLTEKMHDLQAQVQNSTVTENFGTVFGLISVTPELGVVVTSFQYVFSSAETSDWFVNVISGSVKNYSYDYSYTVVNYNYVQSLRGPLKVNLAFGPHLGHRNAFVELSGRSHVLALTLADGTRTLKSDNFDIGVLHAFEGRRLLGHLTFRCSYDEVQRIVTVCGTDFDSSDAMCLVTVPEGTSEYCYQRAASGGFADDDLMANPHWNYRTPLAPGVEDMLRGMARSANESLIAALKRVPGLIVKVRQRPPELTAEDYGKFLTVYRGGKFLGLYEPGRAYGPQDVVVTIESVYGGTVTFPQGGYFANVIGSTDDPKIDGQSWLNLWYNNVGVYPNVCTSFRFQGFQCGNSLVGGHVVEGQEAERVRKGSDSVYIFPICKAHNNNDNVYMAALQYQEGIWLKNYLGS
jgi:uncharacterized coiled-coil protein SlyX